MILLLDIGNTHAHAGLADGRAVRRRKDFPTGSLRDGTMERALRSWVGRAVVTGAAMACVVPAVRAAGRAVLETIAQGRVEELSSKRPCGLPLRYPGRATLGDDRLANALAARHHFGAPCIVVGCGTATTFDVIAADGAYVGGAIAPGLRLMTDYLHERTAQLPEVKLRPLRKAIGRDTRGALLSGAILGHRGLVREILDGIRAELGVRRVPIVATGGDAARVAREVPAITAVRHGLALEGLRLFLEWQQSR